MWKIKLEKLSTIKWGKNSRKMDLHTKLSTLPTKKIGGLP